MRSAPANKVLIETYWNVKINAYNLIWNEWFVLIETYWNVKNFRNERVRTAGVQY